MLFLALKKVRWSKSLLVRFPPPDNPPPPQHNFASPQALRLFGKPWIATALATAYFLCEHLNGTSSVSTGMITILEYGQNLVKFVIF